MARHRNGRRTHLLIPAAYTLAALLLTWPLAAHFGSHVPGNGVDDPPLTWNLWWIKHALLEQGTNPFACDYLFYPIGINLAFYTLTLLNGLLSLPLQATLGLIPAGNLLLLSSFVLGGYGTFLLASRFAESQFAGFVAGLLYAFASVKMGYAALGQWNIASSQWVPFYILFLFKMREDPHRRRYPLLAALFLLFQAYAELTYATFLVLFTLLWMLWHCRTKRDLAQPALVGLIFAIGLLPILTMMLPDMLAEGDILVEGGGFADVFSADLLGFFVPTMYHPLFGSWVERFRFDHTVGQHIYLGYTVLALAAVGVIAGRRRPSVRFWLLAALAFWLLTLGPTLRINGHDTGLPLPFALIARLPFFKGNRYPSRYSVMLFLSLSILVAFGVQTVAAGLRAGRRARPLSAVRYLFLTTALLFEHLCLPLPLSDMRPPPVYDAIAAMPGDFTLLDLPVAWRNGFRVTGTQHPIIMFAQYYQTVHGKRLLAGNTSRNPPLKFQYFTESPVINTLIALETGHTVDPTVIAADRALAADVLRFFNIQAVVVHPESGPEMIPYVEKVMPVEKMDTGGPADDTVAYRVDLPPWPARWTVEPGEPLSRLSYAEGWGLPAGGIIWAQRKTARLLVPLDGQAARMTFHAYAPGPDQRLRVEVNGRAVQWIGMAVGWMEYEVDLPQAAVRRGLNEIRLHFDTLFPAAEVRLAPRTIGGTGVDAPVSLVVHSAGQEVGDFGHIYVAGRDVAPNERGYNLAVINPQSGAVEATAAFDTHLDETAGQAMADFLARVPPGSIVAVAVADEASRLLDQAAVDALRGIGATGDLRGRFRWGQAIIGVRGAAPGTALETMDWMRPVALIVGEGATEPHLAAAFGSITLESNRER